MKNNFYRLQNWLFYIKLILYNLCQYYHFFGPLQAPPYHWPLELFSSVFGPLYCICTMTINALALTMPWLSVLKKSQSKTANLTNTTIPHWISVDIFFLEFTWEVQNIHYINVSYQIIQVPLLQIRFLNFLRTSTEILIKNWNQMNINQLLKLM